jgi:hypothetical protein
VCAPSIFPPQPGNFQTNECSKTGGISSWATKDVDCPSGGCFGFGFVISKNFVASDGPPMPKPVATPFVGPGWSVKFNGITDTSDKCYYPTIPTGSD